MPKPEKSEERPLNPIISGVFVEAENISEFLSVYFAQMARCSFREKDAKMGEDSRLVS